jgi:hypothetical protein
MLTACLLVLLGVCPKHPVKPAQVSFSVAAAALTFGDIAQTVDHADRCKQISPCIFTEHDPLERPFVTHGRAVAYSSATAELLGVAWLGSRLKNSNNRVARKLWWLPQAIEIGGHLWGIAASNRS